jgi:hypothetical protein
MLSNPYSVLPNLLLEQVKMANSAERGMLQKKYKDYTAILKALGL